MLWLHPILQSITLILATWVLAMGFKRFQFQHLGVKTMFPWKRHVLWGKVVNLLWLVGYALGLFMAHRFWGSINLTQGHFYVGTLMVPFLLASLVSGLMLQKPSGKRPRLALFHGAAGALAYMLALYQAYSSVEVIELFLLP